MSDTYNAGPMPEVLFLRALSNLGLNIDQVVAVSEELSRGSRGELVQGQYIARRKDAQYTIEFAVDGVSHCNDCGWQRVTETGSYPGAFHRIPFVIMACGHENRDSGDDVEIEV